VAAQRWSSAPAGRRVRNDWHTRSAARTLPTRRRPLNVSSRVQPRRTSIRHCDESSSRERRRRVSDHRSSLAAADGPSDGLSPSPLRTASRNALGAICAQTLQRVPARPNGRWLRRQDSQICPVERLSPRTARSYVLPISHIMSSKAGHGSNSDGTRGIKEVILNNHRGTRFGCVDAPRYGPDLPSVHSSSHGAEMASMKPWSSALSSARATNEA
jgi:hypothetical protein